MTRARFLELCASIGELEYGEKMLAMPDSPAKLQVLSGEPRSELEELMYEQAVLSGVKAMARAERGNDQVLDHEVPTSYI